MIPRTMRHRPDCPVCIEARDRALYARSEGTPPPSSPRLAAPSSQSREPSGRPFSPGQPLARRAARSARSGLNELPDGQP